MKNDKLFPMPGLINGKKWWRMKDDKKMHFQLWIGEKKSENVAVVPILDFVIRLLNRRIKS